MKNKFGSKRVFIYYHCLFQQIFFVVISYVIVFKQVKLTMISFIVVFWYYPNGQNRQKYSLKKCVFVNSALKIQPCSFLYWDSIGVYSIMVIFLFPIVLLNVVDY